MARRAPGIAAVAGVVLVLVAVGSQSPWTTLLHQPDAQVMSDFQILYAAGQGLSEGLDIHDPEVLDAVGRRFGRPETPFCAALPAVLAGFSLFGPELAPAYEHWLTGAVLAALVTVLALAGSLRAEQRLGRGVALALSLLVVGLPASFWHALAMNSTNILTLAALALAWWAGTRGRAWLEGLALCVAILAKISPALVLVTLLLAGRRAPVLWALGWLSATVAGAVAWVGWEIHVSWFTRVLPVLGYAPEVHAGRFNNALHAWNLAPNGLFTRAADGAGFWAAMGAWLVTALVLWQLVGAVRAWNSGRLFSAPVVPPQLDVGWLYAVSVAAMFLISSVTWPHHLVFAALPGCWLVGKALSLGLQSDRGRMAAVLLGLMAWGVLALPLGLFSDAGTQVVNMLACLALFGSVAAAAAADRPADAVRREPTA